MAEWRRGIFESGMAWSTYGDGDRVALVIPGGPGNVAPQVGLRGSLALRPLMPLAEQGYRLVTVTRRRNMPTGHSISDMARDYADMIAAEFDGRVDLVIGISFGGILAQYLAAEHDSCFGRIVIAVAGWSVSAEGRAIDYRFAEALGAGRPFAAGKEISQALWPDFRPRFLARIAGGIMGLLTGAGTHEHFSHDVMVEAEAERAFDSREVLPTVRVPVLLIAGADDFYFPEAIVRETQSLIPDCDLRLYAGKGHIEAASDPRMAADILGFVSSA